MNPVFLKRAIALALVIGVAFALAAAGASAISVLGVSGNLGYEVDQGAVTIVSCVNTAQGVVDIPSTLEDKPVTKIADSAFEFCSDITGVVIPSTVLSIGEYAFSSCTSLESISIPDSVKSIGQSAFDSCFALKSVSLGSGVEDIGRYVFASCTELVSITVSNSNQTFLSKDGVLYSKDGKTLICCPAGKTGAFSVGSEVTALGVSAFDCCERLTSITLPDSLLSIGDYAFYRCSALTSITIPASVTSVGVDLFYECMSLKNVVLNDGITVLPDNMFNGCEALESVTIPDGITKMGMSAFSGCVALKEIILPDSVEELRDSAFRGCALLTEVRIPETVVTIGKYCFYGCTALYAANFYGEAPKSLGDKAFDETAGNFKMYYLEDYAASWAPNGETAFNGYPIALYDPFEPTVLILKDGGSYVIVADQLRGVENGTTASDIAASFTSPNSIVIVDSADNVLTGNAKVGTGCRIKLMGGAVLLDELVIIMYGDVNGDKTVNSRDIALVQKHIMETQLLIGAFENAADINGDNDVNSRDIARIQGYLFM